ncbi:MAG: DUF5615 family PIN-like protein [Verrucomicrobia bacterium]|nr:DUF5615 family PIN-like protein [Verrucomicrobiota bacterium]
MARMYTNESFPQQAVEILQQLGHDVETSHQAGNSGVAMPDEEVLSYAVREDRLVVTLNRRHFIALHSIRPDHAGIVVCTFDPDFDRLAHAGDAQLAEAVSHHGVLIRVHRPSSEK